MPNVFLSYRRRESSGYSRLLYERLGLEFGAGNVFMDVADIVPGMDWRATLRAHIDAADAVLVLIGRE
ncbi:MAG: TIR domain-containing protein, partial [Burkholderiales bacterium]